MFTPSIWRVRKLAETVPEMLQLQREMNRLFSNVGQKLPQDFPAVNMWDKGDQMIVTAELPGIDPEKIDISVSGETLTIAGSNPPEAFNQGETYVRQERGIGSFKRNIQLPFQINSKEVNAKYEKGILIVTLPRLREDLPKKIKIN
jgi:HSP20 family protein